MFSLNIKSNHISVKNLLQKSCWVLLVLFFFILNPNISFSQNIQTEFGKNRVQYHDDFNKWNLYESENFITYWYGKGRRIGRAVVQTAELDHDEIQNIIEHRINDKIEIIVYTDLSDLKQSNIGNEDVFEGEAGRTKTIGSKMFVYFNGDHNNLRLQIRQGIAQVYINAMFSGSSLQEIVQSNIELNIPKWFEQGIVSFAASSWDHLIDDELRELWSRNKSKYHSFDLLARDHPRVAGHSFWNFMDKAYGKSTIANIMYLIRINRKLERSFEFVLGVSYKDILREWQAYYAQYFNAERDKFDQDREGLLNLKNKFEAPVSAFEFSPDGTHLAYIHNHQGKIRAELLNLSDGNTQTIFKTGYRNSIQETDYNYPLLAWHPNGTELSLIYEYRKDLILRKVFLDQEIRFEEQIIPEEYHRIYSLSYINDIEYIFSASTEGYSDIYKYDSKYRTTERLTEDFHDDLEASYVQIEGDSGILFASNRTGLELRQERIDTILPLLPFDLFFYSLKNKSLTALTNTPYKSERQPIKLGDQIVYLDASSGINNRYILKDGKSYGNSNLNRNIIKHSINPSTNEYLYNIYDEGTYKNFVIEPDWNKEVNAYQTLVAIDGEQKREREMAPVIPFVPIERSDPEDEMKEGYLFQSTFDDPDELEPLDKTFQQTSENVILPTGSIDDSKKTPEFFPQRIVAARTKFKLENFTTSLDNSQLFGGLESYTENPEDEFLNPNVGILFKGKLKDLFEDYEVEAGARIPTNFKGSEYFLVVDDNKKLIDKRFALYRKSETNTVPGFAFPTQETRRVSLLGLYRVSYPLDIYTSIRGTASLREDRFFYLHSNDFSVEQPTNNQKRISLKAEYIFDNTIDKELNIKFGTRYKAYAEVINRFSLRLNEGFEFNASDGFTTVIGLDARHYIPVLRHGVLALRGAGATSLGSDKMLYHIGGVENSIGGNFANNIAVPTDRNFAYRVLAPNLRGFDNNVRNGSSFILANAELRIPIFQLLSKTRIKSSFFRNIQLVGFFDIGTAWHGLLPGSDDNPINSVLIEQPPVLTIRVRYFRDPLIMGYGFGVRTSLFGYFLKVDYGWGIESRAVQDPQLHFSIGLDF